MCLNSNLYISDPDLQAGDGIYSRHLTWRPGSGTFYLKLTLTDGQGAAYTAAPASPLQAQLTPELGAPVCCGSRVSIPESRRKRVGLFLRNIRLAFATAAGAKPARDTIPPAKIGDFAVSSASSGGFLNSSWTAVGGDYHDGEADHYRIYFTAVLADLLRLPPGAVTSSAAIPFIELPNSDKAGSRSRHNLTLPANATGLLYLAVQAVDAAGNGGRVSNPVRIWLADRSSNDTSSLADAQANNASSSVVEDWTIIGIVVGIIAFVLVTLVTLVLCLLCWRRGSAGRATKMKIRTTTSTRSSGVNVHIPSPTRSDATDVSYESEHQLVPAMAKPPPSSTSFANNITPTYWSASQLLSEHEQRTKSLERKVYRDQYSGQSRAAAGGTMALADSQNNSIYNGYTVTPYSDAYGDSAGLMSSAAANPPVYGDILTGKTMGGHSYNITNNNGGNSAAAAIYGDLYRHHNLIDYGTVVTELSSGGGGGPLYGGLAESDQGDYGSDLVDEGMGASSSSTKSRVMNVSDASSATLPMFNSSLRGSLMSLNSNLSKKRHMTQV
jgi:hypothetical protein